MAHPKLTAVNRTLIAASAAALMAGPMAAVGAAASVDTVVDSTGKVVEDLTCEEALKTEDEELIEGFCDPDEIPDPVKDPVRKAKKTADKATNDSTKTVNDVVAATGGDNDDDGSSGGTPVAPGESAPSGGDGGDDPDKNRKGNKVQAADDGGFRPYKPDGARSDTGGRQVSRRPATYNQDGPFRPGMRSHSQLTLQPFAEPVVSVPPVYELPQIAQQLFTGTSDDTAANPVVAGDATTTEEAGAFAPASYNATPADPTGWLAATATGLIMLVGAAHALNGGRTPRRQRA